MNNYKTGDVVHKEVSGMAHGTRPCVVIGVTGDWVHLIPLSTSDWGGQPYVTANGCNAKGYAAPNRYHKVMAADLPAISGWVSDEDAATIWDSAFG